jgi:hypothetical protein
MCHRSPFTNCMAMRTYMLKTQFVESWKEQLSMRVSFPRVYQDTRTLGWRAKAAKPAWVVSSSKYTMLHIGTRCTCRNSASLTHTSQKYCTNFIVLSLFASSNIMPWRHENSVKWTCYVTKIRNARRYMYVWLLVSLPIIQYLGKASRTEHLSCARRLVQT